MYERFPWLVSHRLLLPFVVSDGAGRSKEFPIILAVGKGRLVRIFIR